MASIVKKRKKTPFVHGLEDVKRQMEMCRIEDMPELIVEMDPATILQDADLLSEIMNHLCCTTAPDRLVTCLLELLTLMYVSVYVFVCNL